MTDNKEHKCKYAVRKAIIHKLSRNQVFWLCVLALIVLAIIGIYAPTALVGVF